MRTTLVLSALLAVAQSAASEELCNTTEDCLVFNDYFLCQEKEGQTQKVCVHKPLFPMETKEWVGTFVFAVFMLLANVAGIGGGGVAIPLAMTFFNLSLKPAVAISSFSICIATLARFFFNFNERHPEKPSMVSIDYGMAMVMMPLNLMGSMIGVLFYVVFPDLYLMIILTLVLLVMFIDSGHKYRKMRASEDAKEALQADKAVEQENNKQDADKKDTQVSGNGDDGDIEKEEDGKITAKVSDVVEKKEINRLVTDENGLSYHEVDPKLNARLQEVRDLVRQELSHGIWKKQGINLLALIVLIITSILRGSKGFEKCTTGDNILFGVFIVIMIIFVIYGARLVAHEQALKQEFGNINLVESDLVFRGGVLCKILVLGFVAGWVAGALGLGGGVIFNPLLIGLGVPPRVSSATGMYMITFSKICTCTLYLLNGTLLIDYGLWVAGWSTVGAIIGLQGANIYMAKFNRQSIIVFFLTIVLGLSVVGVPAFGAIDLNKMSENGTDITAFKDLCK